MAGPKNQSGLRGRYWDAKNKAQKKLLNELRKAGKKANGVIAMIDMGQIATPGEATPFKHKDFPSGKLNEKNVLKAKKPSQSGHAMEVAGILDDVCDAEIRHYNVFDNGELDTQALFDALEEIATSGDVAVVNLSIGIDHKEIDADTTLKDAITAAINKCVNAGVFVVAGIGESDTFSPAFPATLPNVISVSAVNAYDRPITDSAKGALFSAPGEGVDVMIDAGGYRKQDGSSYAAPYVAASIWLALAANPALNPKAVGGANPQGPMLTLLQASSRPNSPLGSGATDDQKLQFEQRGSNGTIDIKQLALQLGVPV